MAPANPREIINLPGMICISDDVRVTNRGSAVKVDTVALSFLMGFVVVVVVVSVFACFLFLPLLDETCHSVSSPTPVFGSGDCIC